MPASHATTFPVAARPDPEEIGSLIAEHMGLEGPLLPILHAVQARFGHVPGEAHGPICDALNITRAELHGVISFYHDFRERPAGRHVVRICRSEACQSVGADALAARVLDRLGLGWGGTTPDGRITVEPVYCLGLCACGPAAMIDDEVRGRVDAEALLSEVTR
ncbi:formate dehydrogenase subunit gamma [Roseibacterium sp. SDUM158017]|uniref:formate dehydrogenase subunit gamma n=1 Tax=Roseicyclus salinarum TaxID=3036773 RepID=UPI00241554F9|nr:formate dehydrogenase subunit gamma [Roseibacterium sp. SDUM158017]MDG4648014.1 formate dehydrogenase subunit gamma [Roseibacterium sp. SDUM158017]